MPNLNEEQILELLQQVDIFEGIDALSLLALKQYFKENRFPKDHVIFEEGSIGDSMMLIADGEVRVSQRPEPQGEETLMILKKGDIFGEMSLLEDLPRSAVIIAHTDVTALEIHRRDFLTFIETHSHHGVKILLKMGRTLSSRLREANAKFTLFASLSQW